MATGNSSEISTIIKKSNDNIKRNVVFFLIFVSIGTILIFIPMNEKKNAISQTSPIKTSQSHHAHGYNHSNSLVSVSCVGDSITKGKKY
jgi:hypothetical protein